jgi:lipoprotein-anchoring transpeptidase ErfK/SrfK
MPFFMKFHRGGYGFHGSPDVPGRHASHGCIRVFPEDAEWLSKNFVENETKIVILPYPEN